MKLNIAVIGAGAVGLCSAVNAQRVFPNAKVTVVADRFHQDTTSSGAGGLVRPVLDNTKSKAYEDMHRECLINSWNFFKETAHSPLAGESGVSSVHCTALYNEPKDDENRMIKELCHDYRELSREELEKEGFKHQYGYAYSSFIVQGNYYLKWLTRRFCDAGGVIRSRKVQDLRELAGEFDLVINCAGLGAKSLTGDSNLRPVRGQMLYLKAPWVKRAYFAEGMTYILPQQDRLAVGVTREEGSADLEVKPATSEDILARAQKLLPELKGAEVLKAWVGLRPTRDQIRLETELMACPRGGTLPVIHNYGHSHHGIGLSWGTAVKAVSLAQEVASTMLVSKL